ncbi:MAG: tRNA (adenosine(37)-N6)-threonylcarbamoyltransferase complex dimerization subunit type 1 TsaB [Bacteroidota bacterium]
MKQKEEQGPLILMMETATNVGSVGLYAGEECLGHVDIRKGRLHAKLLLPLVKDLLQKLSVSPADLAAIAVSKGPGSYTGLRVGVSTAKGLCMALDKPLMSLNSLEVLAWQVEEVARKLNAFVAPMIDARRMEVYTALYSPSMTKVEEIHAHILDEHSFQEPLSKEKIIFVGDGAAKAESLFSSHPNALVLKEVLSSTSSLGKPLNSKLQENQFEDLVTFEPFYLKDFVATKPKDRLKETR